MKIDPDKVPATFDEAVQLLHGALSDADKEGIRNSAPGHHHFTIGRYLRNTWSMWEDTPLRRDFIARTKLWGHGDDLSGSLMEAVWCKVMGEPFDLEEHVEQYKEHWNRSGIDWGTGEPVKSGPEDDE